MGAITHPRQPEKPNLCFQAATVKPHSRTGAAMQPVALNDIPDEVFLEDIFELTAALAEELPALFNIMCASLSIAPEDLLITDLWKTKTTRRYTKALPTTAAAKKCMPTCLTTTRADSRSGNRQPDHARHV